MLTLTPQAKAVATFTLGFLLITGSLSRLGLSVAQVLSPHGNLSTKTAAIIVAAITTALGIALIIVANQAVARLDPGWSHALAQAAVVLAVIGTGIEAISLLAAVTGDGLRANFFAGSIG